MHLDYLNHKGHADFDPTKDIHWQPLDSLSETDPHADTTPAFILIQ